MGSMLLWVVVMISIIVPQHRWEGIIAPFLSSLISDLIHLQNAETSSCDFCIKRWPPSTRPDSIYSASGLVLAGQRTGLSGLACIIFIQFWNEVVVCYHCQATQRCLCCGAPKKQFSFALNVCMCVCGLQSVLIKRVAPSVVSAYFLCISLYEFCLIF